MTARSALMCGHCYRPAAGMVYRRSALRRLLNLAAQQIPCCTPCVRRYRKGSFQ